MTDIEKLFYEYTKDNDKLEIMKRHISFGNEIIYSDFLPERIPHIKKRPTGWYVATSFDDMRGPMGGTYENIEEAMGNFVDSLENYIKYPEWCAYYHKYDKNWVI